jgi:tryptophan-rich sensory protein
MDRLASLAVFLLFVVLASIASGQFVGGDWYHSMIKPDWNPSAIVMALVWSVLYVLMAVSAWMIWDTRRGLARVALAWWALQLLLSVCWSWMYFGLERIGWTLVLISVWIVVVLLVIKSFRAIRLEASSLMMPLAAWLVFFWILNYVQWQLNGGGIGSVF